MATTHHTLDPTTLTDEERRLLLEQIRSASAQAGDESGRRVALQVGDQEITLPETLARVLIDTLAEVAGGQPVTVAPADDELTTREAAEVLNVSRPHLVKLLENGAIPFRTVGSHRRVRRRDVLAYKARQREEAEEAMQRLADQAQELGTGY